MEEVGRYLSRDGTEKNLIRLPGEIGRQVGSIGREWWNLMSIVDLLDETDYHHLPFNNQSRKEELITGLMNYYQMLPQLTEYIFTEPTARMIMNYAQRTPVLEIPTQPTIQPTLTPMTTLPPISPQPTVVRPQPTLTPMTTLPPISPQPTVVRPQPTLTPMTALPPITQITGLPPLTKAIPRYYQPQFEYTLENIYNLPSVDAARNIYRSLVPGFTAAWALERFINEIIIEAHNRKYLSDGDFNIHNSKVMEMIREEFSIEQLLNLIDRYNLRGRISPTDQKNKIGLILYRNGVNFSDLMFSYSDEPNLISGKLDYIPKPGEQIEGLYERSGKVDKNQNDLINPISGIPYSYLNTSILRRIVDEREIDVPRGKHQVVFIHILTTYDNILLDWINQVHNPNFQHNRNQLYFIAAELGINLGAIETENLSDQELRDMIKIGRIIMINKKPLPARQKYQQYESQNKISIDDAYNLANKNGYILNRSNIGFPFFVFNKLKNYDETLGYFAELALYPSYLNREKYFTIANENDIMLVKKILRNKYNTEDVMLLDDNHVLFIATRGYLLPDPKFQQIKERYESIRNYPAIALDKLRKIHRITGINRNNIQDLKYAVAVSVPHPLERAIEHIIGVMYDNKLSLQQINKVGAEYALKIGMLIPPNIDGKITYLWDNISWYRSILTRPATIGPLNKDILSGNILSDDEVKYALEPYTDLEIFTYTGVYLPYNSRRDIINNVNAVRRNRLFFVPVARNCGNTETITTLDNTADMKNFIIGYGTLFEYFCYNLEDFDENFTEYPIEGLVNVTRFRFRKPNILNEDFTLDEIRGLVKLLDRYTNIPGVNNTLQNIHNGVKLIREMTNYDRDVLARFDLLSGADKPIIREWLHQLFYTGMYMRRWRGPGFPYPVLKKDTQGEDPNIKVNEELTILGYYPIPRNAPTGVSGITARLSANGQTFVNELRSIEYVRGDDNIRVPRQEDRTIGYYLDRVRKTNMCIRMASSILAGTASYYLGLFFDENIPNYDPTMLDKIV
jgi:hypothetical protein